LRFYNEDVVLKWLYLSSTVSKYVLFSVYLCKKNYFKPGKKRQLRKQVTFIKANINLALYQLASFFIIWLQIFLP